MSKKKYIEIDVIRGAGTADDDHPDAVSREELVARLMAKTGQSEATIRQVIRLFSEYVSKKLDEENEIYIECPDELDMLLRRVDIN